MTAISDQFQFIFIRVPRTSSTTFIHYLEKVCSDLRQPVGYIHAPYWKAKECLEGDYHSFGFIRDPWDWLVSAYNANIASGPYGNEAYPGGLEEPFDAPHLEHLDQRMNMTFPDWVRARETTPMDWLKGVDEIRRKEDFCAGVSKITSSGIKTHRPYREWYDKDLADYVAEKCHREIEIGKYTF